MKYASAPAFRQALEQHINRVNREHGPSHTRIRKLIVFDRFLARLLAASPEGWVLKGGVALNLRWEHHARTTKDLDLGRLDDEEAATEHLLAAAAIDVDVLFPHPHPASIYLVYTDSGQGKGLARRRDDYLLTSNSRSGEMQTVKIRRVGNSNVISLPRALEARGFAEGQTVTLVPLRTGEILLIREEQLDAFIDNVGRQVLEHNREALDKLAAYDQDEIHIAAQ